MAILNPRIAEALRHAGLGPSDSNTSVNDLLDANNASAEDTARILGEVMNNGESSHVRLRAAELAFKLRGSLKDTGPQQQSITIIINDPNSKHDVNPILLPREISR